MKEKDIIATIGGALIFLFLLGTFGTGFGMMGFGFLFMLLFWGIVIWLVVTLVSASTKKDENNEKPLNILNERYARGEITREEYLEKKKELEG